MLKVAADGGFVTILVVVVAELRLADRNVALCQAVVPVLLPEELECDTDLFELVMDIFIVRKLIDLVRGELLREKEPVRCLRCLVPQVIGCYIKLFSGFEYQAYRRLGEMPRDGNLVLRQATGTQLQDELYVDTFGHPSIVTLFHKWNDERLHNGDIRKNSHTKYDNDFKRFFLEKDHICSIPISEVKEADLIRFIKLNINRYNLSRKSYESLRTLIAGIFNVNFS